MLTDPDQTARYLTDWRGVFRGEALAIVRPANTAQVAAVVQACVAESVAIVPQGGNTGLAAGATPIDLPNCIVLSLERLRSIRSIDAQGYTAEVEAGVVLSELHDAARDEHRFFPLSLAAEGSAQIGGLIATNAGGTAVVRYGTMRALVLGIEAVLPDGSIVNGLRTLRKDNAGYDWKQLLIGSEGTLGIITAATLRLFPKPLHRATALLGVASAEEALHAYASLQQALGETLTACELIPDRAIALRIEQEPALKRPIAQHAWYLLIEASSSLAGVQDAVEEALAEYDGIVATSPAQAKVLWSWREGITESEKRAGPSVKHDVSVPVASIPAFLAQATQAVEAQYPGCIVMPFGHFGDGNIHFNVLLDKAGKHAPAAINETVHAIVESFNGSITAEHGIGRYRVQELAQHRSKSELALMRKVKNVIDPNNLMNPGVVLP